MLTGGAFGSGGYDAAASVAVSDDSSTQYGFDLTLLSYFTIFADARLARADVAAAQRRLGDALLRLDLLDTTVGSPGPAAAGGATTSAASGSKLSESAAGIRGLLRALRSAGYLEAFTLDDSDVDDGLWAQGSDLSVTRLSITLTDSASLRAALLLNGRLGASPELTKPLIFAYLRRGGATVTEAQEFFIDDTYRSNPLEYRANQQVLSLTLRPAAVAQAAGP